MSMLASKSPYPASMNSGGSRSAGMSAQYVAAGLMDRSDRSKGKFSSPTSSEFSDHYDEDPVRYVCPAR